MTIRHAMTLLLLVLCVAAASAQLNFSGKTLRRIYWHGPGLYSYAPSIVEMGGSRYIWTCHNEVPFVIRDDINMSIIRGGHIVVDRPVLMHSLFGWDSFHICDPSVMRTQITFNKTIYHWVMFFLGNNVDRSAHNQIGVALAQTVQGPWEKVPDPVIRHVQDGGWGVGQPSALPLAGKGEFLVVYSSSGLHSVTVNLKNLDAIIVSAPVDVTNAGLRGLSTLKVPVSNMDIAYGSDRRRVFAVADVHMREKTYPSFITSRLAVLSISTVNLEKGGGKWRVEGIIGPTLTGFPRNHNAGLVRTARGVIANRDRISIVFTRSCAARSSFPCSGRAEWSYDLWEISAPIHTDATRP